MQPVNIPALVDSAQPAVQIKGGKVMTISTEVARVFSKRHDNVIRDIENLRKNLPSKHLLNFEEASVEVSQPNGGTAKYPAYHLTRDGFTLLVMGFTGKRAMAFKLAYIDAFNRMEAELQGSAAELPPPPMPTKTLTFTVPVNDRTSRWLLHTDRTGREVVTELSPDTHVMTNDQLVKRLMESPADLNLTLSQMLTVVQAGLRSLGTSAALFAKQIPIQPAKPPSLPRGQFASTGIPVPPSSPGINR